MTNARPIVAVAGTNAMKVAGTKKGLEALLFRGVSGADLIVRGVKVPDCPDVPPQPIGLPQTRRGALYRALAALDADLEAEYGVGLENGVLLLDESDPGAGGVDPAVIAIVRRSASGTTYALGPGIPVEGRYILLSLGTGQQKTCGKFIAEETGFDHANWHRDYSGGTTDREELLAATAFLGFAAHFKGH